jgi:hypothetical protein
MGSKPSLKAFSERDELLNLIFPILGLMLAFLEIFFFSQYSKSLRFFFIVTGYILFFSNGLHYIFTHALLSHCEPFQKLWAEKKARVTPQLAILLAVLALIVGSRYLAHSLNLSTQAPLVIFFAGTFAFNRFHTLRQHLGISLIYNAKRRQGNLSERESESLQTSELWEKRLYSVLIFSQIANIIWIYKLLQNDLANLLPFVKHPFFTQSLIGVQIVLGLCVIAFILVDRYYSRSSINKSIFNLRLFLDLLVANSFCAHLFYRATHCVEYFVIIRKIANPIEFRKILVSALVMAAATSGIVYLVVFKKTFGAQYHFAFFCLYVFLYGVAGTWHAFLDGLIFKMQDPAVRKLVGPLFTRENVVKQVNFSARAPRTEAREIFVSDS